MNIQSVNKQKTLKFNFQSPLVDRFKIDPIYNVMNNPNASKPTLNAQQLVI